MSKETLIAIGAGLLSAAAALAFLSRAPGSLIIVYLASLPLLMAGLALGQRAVAIAAAVGFMTAGLFGGAFIAGVFGLMQALPAWLLVRQLLRQSPGPGGRVDWYPVGETLSWLTLLAAALLVMIAIGNAGGDSGFLGLVSDRFDFVLRRMAPHASDGLRARTVAKWAPLLPGMAGGSWLLMCIVNAVLAQAILVRLGRNLRPTPVYAETTLPHWISWPLVAAAALSLIGSGDLQYAGRSLAMVLAVPFFFVGLAVVHTLARRVAYKGMVLVSFYLVLMLWEWAMVAVAGIGVAEQWYGLRHRFSGPSAGTPPATTE